MYNPFYLRVLPVDAPFCNRAKELDELTSHARNKANVVLFSPRRYGKTSLVKRVQERVKKDGVVTIYVDFLGIDSVEDLTSRIASRFYAYSYGKDPLLKKAMRALGAWRPVIRPDPEYGISVSVERVSQQRGIDLLNETLENFGSVIQGSKSGVHVVFDEFQEIVELPESMKVEGLLRGHIQTHSRASYFFVGSRRRVLSDMFNLRKRPFYRSAITLSLSPLPQEDSLLFIQEQFKRGGKTCPDEIARKIIEKAEGYPYYLQRMPYAIFEVSGGKVNENDLIQGVQKTLDEEGTLFEAMLRGLSLQQIRLISALACESTETPFSLKYMGKHGLGSIGGVQGAMKRLLELDYIEKKDGAYKVVDPVFSIWLRHLKK